MQGLDRNQHLKMVKATQRYEEYFFMIQDRIPEQRNEQIRKDITEFKAAHDHYNSLVNQLEDCIKKYKSLNDSLQKKMFPSIRKMNSEIRKQKK